MSANKINEFYVPDRQAQVDQDFLSFEEDMITDEDLDLIKTSLELGITQLPNPHNSVLLYITGLSDIFDFEKARANTIDGTPPDIDIDFDSRDREKAIDWVVRNWGQERVANIVTHQTFKPKGLIRRYQAVNEEPLGNLIKLVPDAKFGKEPSWQEVLATNPDLATQEQYQNLRGAAEKLYNMVTHFGFHAAGIVISSDPISDVVPTWANGKSSSITQYDMKEVEQLGLIKFDFLGIDNLSILKETCRLIEEEKGIVIDLYQIEDGDKKAYAIMKEGLLTGIFQMETSGSAKDLIQRIEPDSIPMTSVISAINRPGPLQAGLDETFINNKNAGYDTNDLPPKVAEILKDTHYTLVYQEQVMKLATDLAGFTLQEADDVRRAMGKKKPEVLAKWRVRFVDGCVDYGGLDRDYAEELWVVLAGDPEDPNNNGFADYCFAGNTPISTPYGVFPIEEMVNRKKQLAHTYRQATNCFVSTDVSQWHARGLKECRTYVFEDGTEITCTPDHKFLATWPLDHEGSSSLTKICLWTPISKIEELGLDIVTKPQVQYLRDL
jgi:DNA polymerase-3 subunit alpha